MKHVLLLVAPLLFAPGVASATVAADLCTGDPCVIPIGNYLVDDGSTLDFGTADVVLEGVLDLTAPAGPGGDVTMIAGSLTLSATGAVRANGGGTQPGGSIVVEVVGDVVLGSADVALRVNGNPGGSVSLDAGGSVTGPGAITVVGQGNGTTGGTLSVQADGDVSLSGTISATSSASGTGGQITVEAGGGVTLSGFVDASGGVGGGGAVSVTGCEVALSGGIWAIGVGGTIAVLGVDALTMSGTYSVTDLDAIAVSWGPAADPPGLAGATFLPNSVQTLDGEAFCAPPGDDDDSVGDDDDSVGDDDDAAGDDDDSAGDDDDAAGDDDDAAGDDDDAAGDDDDAAGDDDDVVGDGPIYVGGGGCACPGDTQAGTLAFVLLAPLGGLAMRRRRSETRPR